MKGIGYSTKLAGIITCTVGLIVTIWSYYDNKGHELSKLGIFASQSTYNLLVGLLGLVFQSFTSTKKYTKGIFIGLGINLLIGFSICTLG